jgi:hypothetical protein
MLNSDCAGYMPTRPDVVVNWAAQEGVDTLRFFFLSQGDPSLALVTPSGKVLCSDNLNPLVLDPYIEVENPEEGQYLAFLGTSQAGVNYPGFLVVTSKEINPAILDLAQLLPRRVDPRGILSLSPWTSLSSTPRRLCSPRPERWQRPTYRSSRS